MRVCSLYRWLALMLAVCLVLWLPGLVEAGILFHRGGSRCNGCSGTASATYQEKTTIRTRIRATSRVTAAPAACGSCTATATVTNQVSLANCINGVCYFPTTAEPPLLVTAGSGATSLLERLLSLHNVVRARHGRPPLTLDPGLTQRAQQSAAMQAQRGRIGHYLPGDAENAAHGQRTEDEAVSSWVSSSGHFANMVNTSYTRVGFGRAGDFWAARFGN